MRDEAVKRLGTSKAKKTKAEKALLRMEGNPATTPAQLAAQEAKVEDLKNEVKELTKVVNKCNRAVTSAGNRWVQECVRAGPAFHF